MQKLKKSQREQTKTYSKDQLEYFPDYINTEDRQLQLEWQVVNDVSGRKSISRAKLKVIFRSENNI